MATYAEMVRLLSVPGRQRRCMYISGDQSVLAEDLIARAEAVICPDPSQRVSVSLDVDSQKEMWAEANARAGARRLVVVRHAERFSGFDKLSEWVLDRSLRENYLILCSEAADWPGTRVRDARNRWVTEYTHKEVRDRLKASGRVVNVSLPREHARMVAAGVAAIRVWGRISEKVAEYAFVRSGFSLVAVRDVMWKARYFDGEVSEKVVDALLERDDAVRFAEALIACDRGGAATASVAVSSRELRGLLRRLEEDVLILGALNRGLRTEESVRKVAEKSGVSVTRAMALASHSAKYDSVSVGRRLSLLASVGKGVADSTMLAALW